VLKWVNDTNAEITGRLTMAGLPTFLGINDTKEIIKKNFQWFVEGGGPGKYLPLMLWGEKGIGKTTSVKLAVKEIEKELGVRIKLTILKLSTMQPFTVMGYPMLEDVTKNGITYKVQRHAIPEYMIEGLDYDYHFIFFDELNRGRGEVQNAIMGMLDGDGVNEHAMLKNTFIIGAGNPGNEDYGQVEEIGDAAILDRMFHVNVATTREETLAYMMNDESIDRTMFNFLSEDHSRIQNKMGYESVTRQLVGSDRANSMVGRFIKFVKRNPLLAEAVAKGLLGDNDGQLYVDRLNQFESIFSPEDVLNKMNKTMATTIKEYCVPTEEGVSRLDVVSRLNDSLILFLNNEGRKELTKKQIKNLKTYLDCVTHDNKSMIVSKSKFIGAERGEFEEVTIQVLTEDSDSFSDIEFR
jgi:MoxR-like ATPase